MITVICILIFFLSFLVEACIDESDQKEKRAEKRNRELIEACEKYSKLKNKNKITKAKRVRTVKNTDGTVLEEEQTIEGEFYD
jgi:hypothetical protein